MDYCLHQKIIVLPNLAPGNEKSKRASNLISLAVYSDLSGSASLVSLIISNKKSSNAKLATSLSDHVSSSRPINKFSWLLWFKDILSCFKRISSNSTLHYE